MSPNEDLIEVCFERGWTDGLPVVPPTPERVEVMLGNRRGEADAEIATLEPSGGIATLEQLAANAVMAGCRPVHLPIVEAAVRACADPAFNLERVLTTASSQVPMIMVSGPAAAAAGLDGGREVLGSGARANATIGRAVMLTLRNVGSLAAGGLPHSTLGNPGARGWCMTENLDESAWDPWHVEQGFDAASTYVAVYPGEAPFVVTEMGDDRAAAIVTTLARAIAVPGTYSSYFREDLWLVMSPQHARILDDDGWDRARLREAIHERARIPRDELEGRGLYGYLDDMHPPVWLEEADPVPVVDGPERIQIAVAGGPFGGYTAIVFGEGNTTVREVTP